MCIKESSLDVFSRNVRIRPFYNYLFLATVLSVCQVPWPRLRLCRYVCRNGWQHIREISDACSNPANFGAIQPEVQPEPGYNQRQRVVSQYIPKGVTGYEPPPPPPPPQLYVQPVEQAGPSNLEEMSIVDEGERSRLQLACGRRHSTARSRAADELGSEDLEEFAALPRIVGGEISLIERWPWQVAIRYQGIHICGGSLVDSRHIITAAHCFSVSKTPADFWVYLGKSVKTEGEQGEIARSVSRIVIHPQYNQRKHDSDIAILRLNRPVQLSRKIVPACLPLFRKPLAHGTKCHVTGYGETKGTGGEGYLKEAVVPIIGNEQCRTLSTTYQQLLTENMICSGLMEGGVDSCQGDSGGPLICETRPMSGIYVLHGVVSFGVGCAARRSPGVYTRVANFAPWIRRVVASTAARQTAYY